MTAPILVFGIGNESRGDDALGPLLVRDIQSWSETAGLAGQVEVLEDYQLQVEHVTDLLERSAVLFVDADVSCAEPFELSEVSAERNGSYTSHAMNPAALLHAYRLVYGVESPPGFTLRIRGHDFALGQPLSERATANLQGAIRLAAELCRTESPHEWRCIGRKLAVTGIVTE